MVSGSWNQSPADPKGQLIGHLALEYVLLTTIVSLSAQQIVSEKTIIFTSMDSLIFVLVPITEIYVPRLFITSQHPKSQVKHSLKFYSESISSVMAHLAVYGFI